VPHVGVVLDEGHERSQQGQALVRVVDAKLAQEELTAPDELAHTAAGDALG
jgi:hypothetical protein